MQPISTSHLAITAHMQSSASSDVDAIKPVGQTTRFPGEVVFSHVLKGTSVAGREHIAVQVVASGGCITSAACSRDMECVALMQELFQPFGQISRIYIAYDRETGENRGFAFVNFVSR